MPGIDNQIALKTQVPDAMKSIGSMLNIAGQQQQLQAGQQQIQRGGLALQQEQMDMGERRALQSMAGKLNEYKTESGELDLPKLLEAATTAAPKFGMDWVQRVASANVQSIAAKSALNKLSEEQRNAIGQVVMSVSDQPLTVQEKALNAVVQGNPQLRPWADLALVRLRSAKDDAERKTIGIKLSQATMGVGEQNQALGSRVATGGELKPAGPIAEAGGTPTLPVTLGPGQLESVEPDVLGNKAVITRSPQGTVTGTRAVPGGGQGGTPAQVPQWNLPAGVKDEIPARTAQRVAVNTAAAKVPEQRFNNAQIIALAPAAFTGTGGENLTRLGSLTGVQMVPGDHAANRQRLGHFMALQAQANASAMGAGTDAAREISQQATGSGGWTDKAIISTAKVNDALSTGVDYFNRGMEKAIAANNGNVLAVRDFQNAWSQNFDPRAMQLHNAIQAGDKQEIAEVVKAAGGAGSPGAKALARKTRNLEKLANDGKL